MAHYYLLFNKFPPPLASILYVDFVCNAYWRLIILQNAFYCCSFVLSNWFNFFLLLVLALYFVPAFMYCLYNNLTFVNLEAYDPTTYFLLLQFRVVVTGVIFQVSLVSSKISSMKYRARIEPGMSVLCGSADFRGFFLVISGLTICFLEFLVSLWKNSFVYMLGMATFVNSGHLTSETLLQSILVDLPKDLGDFFHCTNPSICRRTISDFHGFIRLSVDTCFSNDKVRIS